MTTPWQELTLFGGWAKAQIPPPIASGVNARSATFSVSLPTSNPRLTITQYGGPPQIEIAAFSSEWEMMAGVRGHRLPQAWFRGSFLQRWTYTTQLRYHPALPGIIRAYAARRVPAIRRSQSRDDRHHPGRYRSYLSQWKYRLLVRFHPVLRAVIKMYAARIVVPPSHRPR
jgi:hypothetical protein